MTDPRSGLGGYVNDTVGGGMQLPRAIDCARRGELDWAAILVAEAGENQRQMVLANRQLVDRWRSALNPLGTSVGVTVVHGTDPVRDASHYQAWRHVDFWLCNAEREYVEDPTRTLRFLVAVGDHPPLVLSTNGDPAQKPMDYRRWEMEGAWLATQAYWQFNVVGHLTPKVAHQNAYLPAQVNVGPSSTSWWYRVWIRGKGNRWTQSVKLVGVRGKLYLQLLDPKTMTTWHAEVFLAGDGGYYLTTRVLLANGTRDAGRVLGFCPKLRITPHISNEAGDTGRPTLADLSAKIRACPTRKVAVGVFTLDTASDAELRTIKEAMNS